MDRSKERFLVSTDNMPQSQLYQQILKSNNIPYYVEKSGSGEAVSVYMGYSTAFGEDIIVSNEDYEKAFELIGGRDSEDKKDKYKSYSGIDKAFLNDNKDKKKDSPYVNAYKRRKAFFKLCLRVFIFATIALVIYCITIMQ